MQREYDFTKGKRGAVLSSPTTKTRITIRLDTDIVEWFRMHANENEGASYQTLINRALRDFITEEDHSLEQVLRRVLREELRKSRDA